MADETISHLNSIHARAAHACDSAPRGMAARWAEAYYNGDHAKRQAEMNKLTWAGKYAGENNEGGVSLIRIVDCYNDILSSWQTIANSLPDTSGHSKAQDIYNAYDRALDEYWAIMRRTAEGLRLEGTRYWIGPQFKSMIETHRNAFNAAAPKIVAETKSLGTEKHGKMQEWTDRSQEKFADVIKAATSG